MSKILSVSNAKNSFNSIISSNETTIVTKNGKPVSVMVPFESYEEMYKAKKHCIDLDAIEKAEAIKNGKRKTLSHEELLSRVGL
ncbi:MAG: prevent-host-death family protein [bacterium]|jgi:prevent-host-death family protein